jgi:hypothetical protein
LHLLQSFDKVQKNLTDQGQLINQLMQERTLLKQQTQLLQQQGREQADKLRRTQLQKQRLEALCRSLQVGPALTQCILCMDSALLMVTTK